jgi:hypothetical protein
MRKLILLLFIPLVFACDEDSDDVPNMCVDETLIDLESVCTEEFQPVCGCDDITYNNSCEAFNWHGVIAYSDGPCD